MSLITEILTHSITVRFWILVHTLHGHWEYLLHILSKAAKAFPIPIGLVTHIHHFPSGSLLANHSVFVYYFLMYPTEPQKLKKKFCLNPCAFQGGHCLLQTKHSNNISWIRCQMWRNCKIYNCYENHLALKVSFLWKLAHI